MVDLTIGIDSERFKVLDGKRTLTFEGWQLAEASSRLPTSDRWIEMKLFVNTNGTYILSKVGCSDVFHSSKCSRPSKGVRHEELADALAYDEKDYDPAEVFTPCRECRPSTEDTPVWVETDMHSAPVFRSVDLLFDALHQRKQGVRSLSRVSRALLDEAQQYDPAISRIMNTSVEVH